MPHWAPPDTTDETLRVLQDEAVSQAFVDSSIPESKIRREVLFERVQISGGASNIQVPNDGGWRRVSDLANAVGGPIVVTPRSSGVICASWATSWFPNNGTLRATFGWDGTRVAPDNGYATDPSNGLIYSNSTTWVPFALEYRARMPLGVPFEIEPQVVCAGGGGGEILGSNGHSYLYVWEMF